MESMVRNIKLTIAYDGTNYHGWQIQNSVKTVQETIEKAIEIITKEKINLIGSGRTDKGVHAIGQVANFSTNSKIETSKIKIAINANLPKDIRIINSEEEELEFNSRYDAKKKTYLYQIYNNQINSPFYNDYTLFLPFELNLQNIEQSAKKLVGTHDFKAFMSTGSEVKTTIRTIFETKLEKENNIIKFSITGNGFLYNMVRIIVGTLIDIGMDKKDLSCFDKAFEIKDRTILGATAKPEGLFLKNVYY